MPATTIHSLKELQLQMPRILDQHGSDPKLTVLALANPLLALEKIGYTFSPEARDEIERHIRFGKQKAARYEALQREATTIAGVDFKVNDSAQLEQHLSRLLQFSAEGRKAAPKAASPDLEKVLRAASLPVIKKAGSIEDPLEAFTSLHPVIAPIVALRKMEAEAPSLGTQAEVDKLKNAAAGLKVRFRLSRKNERPIK